MSVQILALATSVVFLHQEKSQAKPEKIDARAQQCDTNAFTLLSQCFIHVPFILYYIMACERRALYVGMLIICRFPLMLSIREHILVAFINFASIRVAAT